MKVCILVVIFICSIMHVDAQHLKVPELSPASKLEQTIGLTQITIEYSRPSARGRKVFGELVPYGKLWRTGANLNSTITFSDDVSISNNPIKKGAYAIFSFPQRDEWEIIIYDAPLSYTPQILDDAKVIARFKTPTIRNASFVESFTFDIADIKTSSANLMIKWADQIVTIPFEVGADEIAMKNISDLMNGPSADDLFQAAEYYFSNDKDLDQALEWTKQSGAKYGWDAYWPHYLEARILVKKNRYEDAVVAGERAAAYVRKAGYIDVADQLDAKVLAWKKKI